MTVRKKILWAVLFVIMTMAGSTNVFANVSNKEAMKLYDAFLQQDSYRFVISQSFRLAKNKKWKRTVDETINIREARFTVLNLDKTGVKELFVCEPDGSAYYVFTVLGGKVTPVGLGGIVCSFEEMRPNSSLISIKKRAIVYYDKQEGSEWRIFYMKKGRIRKMETLKTNFASPKVQGENDLKYYHNGKRISLAKFIDFTKKYQKMTRKLKNYRNTAVNRAKYLR